MPSQMNPLEQQKAQLLAQMKDIHTPEPIGLWPPAIGWWVIFLLLLSACVGLFRWLHGHHVRNKYRQQALKQLDHIQRESSTTATSETLQKTMKLLKQTLFSAYTPARRTCGGLHGLGFLQLLDLLSSDVKGLNSQPQKDGLLAQHHSFITTSLYTSAGAANGSENHAELQQFFTDAQQWIKKHKRITTQEFEYRLTHVNAEKQALSTPTPAKEVANVPV